MESESCNCGGQPGETWTSALSPQERRYHADARGFLEAHQGRQAYHAISLVWGTFADEVLMLFATEHRRRGEIGECRRLRCLANSTDLRPKLAAIWNHCDTRGGTNKFMTVHNTLFVDLADGNDDHLYEHARRLERCLRDWAHRVAHQNGIPATARAA